MKHLVVLSSILFVACGDNINNARPDASADSSSAVDAAIDAPPFVAPEPFKIDISSGGPDQVMSAAAGPNSTFYVAGFTAATPTGAKYPFVARLTSAGALDSNFGTTGIYTSPVEFKGASDEIDVVVQSDGKVVVSFTIANDIVAADRDIGLFRVTTAGVLDTSFNPLGTSPGFSRINLSNAYDDAGTLKAFDASRALAVGPNDQLFLHATSRDPIADAGASIDTDFTVARLTSLGVLDTAGYGTLGMTRVDLAETDNVATVKSLAVLADGSVIGSGYAKTGTTNGTAQPVLYRLNSAGGRDNGFAGGVFHEVVLTKQTEIYSFAVDGDRITTAGYGRETGDLNVWASMRFDTTTGARSTTFGGVTGGVATVDPAAGAAGSNCRFAVGLPGGKTALIGSTGSAPSRDAALAILTQTGALDTSYGTGVHTFQLDGDDQFWGAAVSNGVLLVAGWRGQAVQSDSANDDSFGLLLPLQ
jgi:uncharacterized delta-60 repeat protein